MAINKKLIHFNTFENFNSKKLSANAENTLYTVGINDSILTGSPDILYQSIVYIKDTKQQWTHGLLYNCSDSESLLKTYTFYYEGYHLEYTITQEEFEKIQNADIVYFSYGTEHIQLIVKKEFSSNIYFYGYNLSEYPDSIQLVYVSVNELKVIINSENISILDYISDLVNGSEPSYMVAACAEIVDGAYIEIVENANVIESQKPLILILTDSNLENVYYLFGPYITFNQETLLYKFIGEYDDLTIECVLDAGSGFLLGTLHIKPKSEGGGGDLSDYATKEELNTKLDNITDLETIRTNANIGANSYSWSILEYIFEYVDLGLPSGTLWATCNFGATKPEEYGGYYAWGELEEKEDYEWSTYKWCNGSYDSLTKYCTDSIYGKVDNKTILEPSNDVARVNWGGNWRMPTAYEIKELMNICNWEWTTLNGVDGYKVTGSNGNSIFLPAVGYRYGTDLNYSGSYGYYWSSSLVDNLCTHAHNLYLSYNSHHLNDDDRSYGFSIRPVYRINTALVEGKTLIISNASYSNDTIRIYEKGAIVDNKMLIL